MDMVEFSLGMVLLVLVSSNANDLPGWIKHWFPEFELTWLGGEMRENLPKEIHFTHEARNARRAEEDFKNLRTSLYIRTLTLSYASWNEYSDLHYS